MSEKLSRKRQSFIGPRVPAITGNEETMRTHRGFVNVDQRTRFEELGGAGVVVGPKDRPVILLQSAEQLVPPPIGISHEAQLLIEA